MLTAATCSLPLPVLSQLTGHHLTRGFAVQNTVHGVRMHVVQIFNRQKQKHLCIMDIQFIVVALLSEYDLRSIGIIDRR